MVVRMPQMLEHSPSNRTSVDRYPQGPQDHSVDLKAKGLNNADRVLEKTCELAVFWSGMKTLPILQHLQAEKCP